MEVQIKRLLPQIHANVCFLSKDIFNSLNLSEEVIYNIHLGQSSEYYNIHSNEDIDGVMSIPEELFSKYLIFHGMSLNIRRENDDIYLGPVVGVFINYNMFPLSEYKTYDVNHGAAALSESCLCYYFSIHDIDWNKGKIKGYTLLPQSEIWACGWFPMPSVIYDRGVRFKEKEKPLVKEIRKRFKNNPEIKMINGKKALSKKETYKKLVKYPQVSKFLPETIDYKNFDDLFIMLMQYDFIFLKASYGTCGREVLSIKKEGEAYKLTFYSSGLKNIIINNMKELRDFVEEYTEGHQFIIQKGIRLLKYKGRVFDMRIIVIKDSKGKWRAINNWGRIAPKSCTITNYSTGGVLEPYETMYPYLMNSFSEISIPDEKEIERVTILIAEYIEKAFGSMGELGMDIAIDEYGDLWLIEANTKPMKDIIEGYDDFDEIHPQYLAIFQYAKFLSGFSS